MQHCTALYAGLAFNQAQHLADHLPTNDRPNANTIHHAEVEATMLFHIIPYSTALLTLNFRCEKVCVRKQENDISFQ